MKRIGLTLFFLLHAACTSTNSQKDRLKDILERGTLYFATTGDYRPFSFKDQEEDWMGIDIDLAQDLARTLGVKLVLVRTTWPTLMKDYQKGDWDIAMSGISKNLERQKVASFSISYQKGGKAAIVRCSDVLRFKSLAKIDRKGVRVIVNPGGTNERFIRERIKKADIRVFDDNKTIFKEISQKRSDVMITDRIEVQLQSALDKSLCSAFASNLTYSEKAALLPRDWVWKEYVDTWLIQLKASGRLQKIFDKHLKK